MSPGPARGGPSEPARLPTIIAGQLDAEIRRMTSLAGGDVAESFRVDLVDGATVFAKTHRRPPPGFFTTEASGLAWLRSAGSVPVPEVIAVSDEPPLLILEWLDEAAVPRPDEAAFGRALADLHRAGAPCFGRRDRRTTGSRGLPNEPTDTWPQFYCEQRLLPLAKLAGDAGALAPAAVAELEALAGRLDRLGVPEEPPARLHGDLWAGNRLVDDDGRSWLIDPACHGGHREFDLAMMRLFGGFDEACHRAYHEHHPLADGWQERVALHQVVPLVVHAIKFGGGYRTAAVEAIERYR